MDQLSEGGALLVALQDIKGSSWCLLARLWKRRDHLKGEVLSLAGFMMLRGEYGTEIIRPDVEKRLKAIKAGRQSQSKSLPWGGWLLPKDVRQRILYHLMFFAYLEGLSVERIGGQYALHSIGSESACITGDEEIEIYGKDDVYQRLEAITGKWIGLGAPQMDSYLAEVWAVDVLKRAPENGWLARRQHTQLIFRLKREWRCDE